MWRVNRERVVLLSGPAAATMQVAHPVVAHGVDAHSLFRVDPVGRLLRTLRAVYTVAFGTSAEIEEVRQRVLTVHRGIRGPGYSAFDQDALLWVLATLVMGSVLAYERFVEELTVLEKEQLLSEYADFGEVFGLAQDRLPRSWSGFQSYWEGMISGPVLGTDPLCGRVAHDVLSPTRPLYFRACRSIFRAFATGFMPARLCEKLGIPPTGSRLWKFLDRCLPPLVRILPKPLRYDGHYLRACRRERKRASQK